MLDGDEEPKDAATAVLPATPAAPARPDPLADGAERRIVLLLVSAGLVIILGAAIGIAALWPRSDDGGGAALTVPPGSTAWPIGSAPAGSAAPSPSASASVSASPSVSVTPSGLAPSTLAPTSASAATPTAPPSAPATLAPPPAADRIGVITGAGGHCLDVRGGIAFPGSPVSVYDCNGTLSQRWTVAADGTLRVSGVCAVASGAAVQQGTCGDADSGQWRAGPGASLVNVGTQQCLTDPDNGAKTGNRLQLAACGGSGQSWVLP